MTAISEFRTGAAIRFNNDIWIITEFHHVTPGNWRAMMQVKMRSVKTGSTLEYRFRSVDKVEQMAVEVKPADYLYQKGNFFVFMSTENYEEISISLDVLKEKAKYMKENQSVMLVYCDGGLIDVQLPVTVDLKITETTPPLKTATITNVSKPATMETGLVVQVPAFIELGETIRIDTRDGRYVERVKVE